MQDTIIRTLSDGLVLRHATPDDAEEVATFNAQMHMGHDATEPDRLVDLWTRDLMAGTHHTVKASDFLVVEDTQTGKVVSTTMHISQVWSYEGIPFKVGRPELVATHPDYRNRGLVRAQFEELHRWSAERGEMVQAITGIQYYYRQFGYEMTLSFPAYRIGYKALIPILKEGEPEPFVVRPATEDELPFIGNLYDRAMSRYLISARRDLDVWLYEMKVRTPQSGPARVFCIIETPDGKTVGSLVHYDYLFGPTLGVWLYELLPGVRWAAATPSVLRYLGKRGVEYAERDKKREFGAFMLGLGASHPVYDIIASQLPRKPNPYCYYIRVPDVPAFIRHVGPALDARLPGSPFEGHSGELKINSYRSAFKLVFSEGKLTSAEPYTPDHQEDGDAFFPNLTFLHMLFGHLDLEEINHVYPDCAAQSDEVRALLKTLFPKRDSLVLAIG